MLGATKLKIILKRGDSMKKAIIQHQNDIRVVSKRKSIKNSKNNQKWQLFPKVMCCRKLGNKV